MNKVLNFFKKNSKKNFTAHTFTGFTFVEAILAASILGLLVTPIVGAFVYGNESTRIAASRAQALNLADEGIEAVRNIRDQAYTNLVDGTYGLGSLDNHWQLTGTFDITGQYTRAIRISTVDGTTKTVTVDVTWQQNLQRLGSVSLSTYFTHWLPTWVNPGFQSVVNLLGGQNGIKVAVAGNYAYFITNELNKEFNVVDISDLDNPVLIDSVDLLGYNPVNIAINGNYAYIATKNNTHELVVVNLTNPLAVTVVGSYDTPGSDDARGVFVVGNTVYIGRDAGPKDEFWIIDASNPVTPTLLGSLNLTRDTNEIMVMGNYAYLATDDNNEELKVIDVSDPTRPLKVGSYNIGGTKNALCITGVENTVFVGDLDKFVYIFDVTVPTAPELLARYTANGMITDVAYGVSPSGNKYLFLATDKRRNGVVVLDVNQVSQPLFVGAVNAHDTFKGVVYDESIDRAFAVGPTDNAEFVIIQPQ